MLPLQKQVSYQRRTSPPLRTRNGPASADVSVAMVLFNSVTDVNILLFTYMLIYNVTLISLFWALLNVIVTQFKTLQSFNGFSFSGYYLLLLTSLLFSMAGVPPFMGFFSKLFVLTLLTNNSFFVLYTLFFAVLFLGLYFYVQNIRFLHSTNHSTLNYSYLGNDRHVCVFYYFSITVLVLLIGGAYYVDDTLLLVSWLLN